jgi:hypothetical protein
MEGRMNQDNYTTHKHPVADRLHPMVWIALVGFVIWFAIAIWSFGVGGYADWLLTVVSVFLLIAVTLPVILSRVGRDPHERTQEPFHDWASGEFQTWQDRPRGLNAAAEIVLPVAAAAVGMTAIGIVFHYAAMHAPFVTSV